MLVNVAVLWQVADTQRLVHMFQENMSSHRNPSVRAASPLQARTPGTFSNISAAGGTDALGQADLGARGVTKDVSFAQTCSLLPVVAAPSDSTVQDAAAESWEEAPHALAQAMTGHRRLSFAANLGQARDEAPEREPPFAERSSAGSSKDELPQHTSLQSTDGARAPCCLWVCGRGGVAPEGSDGREGSRASNLSQASYSVAQADLTSAIAKALRRPRRQRSSTIWRRARSWQWWTSVTDVYTGKVTRLRRGHALHPMCPLSLAWNTYLNVTAAVLIIVLPLLSVWVINMPIPDIMHKWASLAFAVDVIVSFARGYKIGTTSDLIELQLARCAHVHSAQFVCSQPGVQGIQGLTSALPGSAAFIPHHMFAWLQCAEVHARSHHASGSIAGARKHSLPFDGVCVQSGVTLCAHLVPIRCAHNCRLAVEFAQAPGQALDRDDARIETSAALDPAGSRADLSESRELPQRGAAAVQKRHALYFQVRLVRCGVRPSAR